MNNVFIDGLNELKKLVNNNLPISKEVKIQIDYIFNRINKISELEEGFELVFVGQKAAGKSSVINFVLGKVYEAKNGEKEIVDILKTGAVNGKIESTEIAHLV
ncbi:MAG TPA: hypothetical protein VKX31_03655 [Brumimicrobium sp.]|nr:hypothetical protein [Brumimicrobium sp.]